VNQITPNSREAQAAPFEVVFVCTGNQARSALAEALYRRYSAGLDTRASSYGTQGHGAMPALPTAIKAATRLGIDLTSHRSRSLRRARLDFADLVLGFEPFHLSIAVVDAGASPDRTFLLGEFASVLAESASSSEPSGRAREIVMLADARRVRSRPDQAAIIADPVGKADNVMDRTAARIDELTRRIVIGLFGIVPELTAAGDNPEAVSRLRAP
jgi:protein-tyrosine-phosphatase